MKLLSSGTYSLFSLNKSKKNSPLNLNHRCVPQQMEKIYKFGSSISSNCIYIFRMKQMKLSTASTVFVIKPKTIVHTAQRFANLH